jgi:DNA-binding XRE family transcriptional regulator
MAKTNFAQFIRRTRADLGMTQPQMDDKLGVTRGSTARWEGGRGEPRNGMKEKIVAQLSANGTVDAPAVKGFRTIKMGSGKAKAIVALSPTLRLELRMSEDEAYAMTEQLVAQL